MLNISAVLHAAGNDKIVAKATVPLSRVGFTSGGDACVICTDVVKFLDKRKTKAPASGGAGGPPASSSSSSSSSPLCITRNNSDHHRCIDVAFEGAKDAAVWKDVAGSLSSGVVRPTGLSFPLPPAKTKSYLHILRSFFSPSHPKRAKPHQQVLVERFATARWTEEKRDPLLLYWMTGSGKTYGIVAAMNKNPALRTIVVCDISIIGAWVDEIRASPQREGPVSLYRVMGYHRFSALCAEDPDFTRGAVVVVDEAHGFRKATSNMETSLIALENAAMLFCLSATPYIASVGDGLGLERLMRIRITSQYVEQHGGNLPDPKKDPDFFVALKKAYAGKVSFYDGTKDAEVNNLPSIKEELIRVPLSWTQVFAYFYYESQAPSICGITFQHGKRNSYQMLQRLLCNGYDLEDSAKSVPPPAAASSSSPVKNKNGKRPLPLPRSATTAGPALSPKLASVVENVLREASYPTVIFSHFLANGVYPIERSLREKGPAGLSIERFTGGETGDERARLQKRFNLGTVDVLLLSPAAKQGLDLLTAKRMILVDPAAAEQLEKQILARVVRMESKTDQVKLTRFISTFPTSKPSGADLIMLRDKWVGDFGASVERSTGSPLPSVKELVMDLAKKCDKSKQTVDEQLLFKKYAQQSSEIGPFLAVLRSVGGGASMPAAAKQGKKKTASAAVAAAV